MRTGQNGRVGRREGTHLVVRAREARIVPVVDLALVADDGEEVVVVQRFGPEVPVPNRREWGEALVLQDSGIQRVSGEAWN